MTSDLSVRYLSPCAGDAFVTARLIKLGRTLCPVNVELCDSEGRQVALAQVCYMRVEAPPVGP